MPRTVQTRPYKPDAFARLGVGSRLSICTLVGALGTGAFSALAQNPADNPPAPAPNVQLPTGGQVSAGQATISQSGNTLNINQTSQKAVVDWNTFNLSKDATVNFQQPNAQSATLNRVTDTQPSHILGRITAPGQVILVNPQGVYFGKSASVDVGGLVATTHDAANREFMDGQIKLSRNGATGKVQNEGELRAALGGYIAMLAPEVRNSGVIVANLGTVALAAGETFELKFDGNGALSNVRVTAASINTLIENKNAIKAPGGLIILSAKAASRLQTAVINNSGSIEAAGLARRAGRILLEATSSILNSGFISANATGGADGGPAGTVNLNAPEVQNSGTVSAANFFPESGKTAAEAGRISIQAETFTQTSSGLLDVSAIAAQSGVIDIETAHTIALSGRVFANGLVADPAHIVADALGGSIHLQATRRIDLTTAVLDASGEGGGGRIHLQADGDPAPAENPSQPVRGAVLLRSNTELRVNSPRAMAGRVEVEGDDIALETATRIDATGATGGGVVLMGGDSLGGGALRQATQVSMSADSVIDASATDNGDGGQVVLWSDIQNVASMTTLLGIINATGGANGGHGGRVETAGVQMSTEELTLNLASANGAGGTWHVETANFNVDAANAKALVGVLNTGASVAVNARGGIVLSSAVHKTAGGDAALTFNANGNISLGQDIKSDSGKLKLFVSSGYAVELNAALVTLGGDVLLRAGNSQVGANYGIAAGANGLVNTGSGNVSLVTPTISDNNLSVSTTGILTIAPNQASAWSRFTWAGTYGVASSSPDFTLSNIGGSGAGLKITNLAGIAGLNVGQYTDASGRVTRSAADLTVARALAIDGPVQLYGGSVSVNADLTSTRAGAGISVFGAGQLSLAADKKVQTVGGDIRLGGDAVLLGNQSVLRSSSPHGVAGRVEVEGDVITLATGSRIEAQGSGGGGTVLIGGDWQGGGTMRQATRVSMSSTSVIDASATDSGNGGKVVLWSDVMNANAVTTLEGTIYAQGGPNGGNGGQVETSGAQINMTGLTVNASAPAGAGGLWLIDPHDFDVNAGVAAGISAALGTGTSVTVATTDAGLNPNAGDITVSSAISKTAGGDASLVLKASRRVLVMQDISSSTGKLNVVLWSGNGANLDGGVSVSGAIVTHGGHFWAGGTRTWNGTSTWNGLTVGNGAALGPASGSANAFDLTGSVTTAGGDVLMWAGSAGQNAKGGFSVGPSGRINAGSGNVTLITPAIWGNTLSVDTTGLLTLAPDTPSAWSGFDWAGTSNGADFTLAQVGGAGAGLKIVNIANLRGLTVGHYAGMGGVSISNTADVLVSTALSIAGNIALHGGNITLAAGASLQTTGGDVDLIASAASSAMNGIVLNLASQILTQGGTIHLQATRRIALSGAVLDASAQDGGGRIYIQANGAPNPNAPNPPLRGVVLLSGATLRTASARAGAGRVEMEGDEITLDNGTLIDATGATGGGVVLIGGDWQGSGTMRQATTVTMSADSFIDASATDHGDGGKVVLWSSANDAASATAVHGTIHAKAGLNGGDGGNIETSGHLLQSDDAQINASSALGRAGVWLIDPYNITISTNADSNVSSFTSSNTPSNINVATITNSLNSGTSVVVQTGAGGGEIGDIQVNTPITKTGGGYVSLTLKAHNNVVVSNAISSTSNKLDINLVADSDKNGAGVVIINSDLTSNGGNIAFGTGSTINFGGVTTQVGGDVYVTGSTLVTWTTSGGSLSVYG